MRRPISRTVKSVVLLSGGLDSALNLALAARYRAPVLALTFDYGQRAARPEVKAARSFAAFYGVDHRVLSLPWFREFVPRAMARPGATLPSRPGATEAIWVPNRNGVFVAVGAAVAEAVGARALVAGFNADEAADFPDNSPAFVAASNRSLRFSTRGRVRLVSYTLKYGKAAIVTKALARGVPLELIYPCYAEGPRPCGRCVSCRRTMAALADAGQGRLRTALFGAPRG